jgi:ABC-2 type transport system ATP-binding protein
MRMETARSGVLARTTEISRVFGSFKAVEQVSLEVCGGEIVGLLGANGAGKTTLIRMLLGLLPASSGTASLFGEPPSLRTRRRIGYVPQGLGIWADLTVAENLDFSASAFGAKLDGERLPASLTDVRNRLAGTVGLGRQRQLAFACALGHSPELLVLDEPTSGVDPLARARLWDRVHDEAEGGAGVIVTTHYLEEARQCDRVIMMASGRVMAQGTVAQVTGGATAVRVRSAGWARAFDALSEADLLVTLCGREIRVAGATIQQVRAALRGAEVDADLDEIPANLEETMITIGQERFTAATRPSPG